MVDRFLKWFDRDALIAAAITFSAALVAVVLNLKFGFIGIEGLK